ncbi:hypothetical protein A8C56_06425 [Niabella ginsenosidivorans]|uniref:Uncharacterized protein n=1 Tax=Niabella ginsenosidivorans TaxID=1176587 RepID=A0A1A9I1R5_9BACT|nr:hypothetical protein A8C56_06425 [Niabella ginsenosidivorans]
MINIKKIFKHPTLSCFAALRLYNYSASAANDLPVRCTGTFITILPQSGTIFAERYSIFNKGAGFVKTQKIFKHSASSCFAAPRLYNYYTPEPNNFPVRCTGTA